MSWLYVQRFSGPSGRRPTRRGPLAVAAGLGHEQVEVTVAGADHGELDLLVPESRSNRERSAASRSPSGGSGEPLDIQPAHTALRHSQHPPRPPPIKRRAFQTCLALLDARATASLRGGGASRMSESSAGQMSGTTAHGPGDMMTSAAVPEIPQRRMSVRGAAFLGIGSMVGAGIFALLGEAGAVAGSAVWLSFLIAGIVALLLGYNVVKLGVRYPSSGGLIAYLLEGFGNGRLVGIASWLGYFAAIVIVCSMVAVAFGSYATSLFIGNDAASGWDNVFTSLIIVAMVGINLIGARFVDRAQSLIVVVLLAVFAVFIVATLVEIDP